MAGTSLTGWHLAEGVRLSILLWALPCPQESQNIDISQTRDGRDLSGKFTKYRYPAQELRMMHHAKETLTLWRDNCVKTIGIILLVQITLLVGLASAVGTFVLGRWVLSAAFY